MANKKQLKKKYRLVNFKSKAEIVFTLGSDEISEKEFNKLKPVFESSSEEEVFHNGNKRKYVTEVYSYTEIKK